MITLQIPLQKWAKIKGIENCNGQNIICDTTFSTGKLAYIDGFGICRRKDNSTITTVNQAYVVVKLKTADELTSYIKQFNPTNVWI